MFLLKEIVQTAATIVASQPQLIRMTIGSGGASEQTALQTVIDW
jgi:hypothetical protein